MEGAAAAVAEGAAAGGKSVGAPGGMNAVPARHIETEYVILQGDNSIPGRGVDIEAPRVRDSLAIKVTVAPFEHKSPTPHYHPTV